MKFRNHPGISFIRKAIQSTNIPVKILKQNVEILESYICHFFNACVDKGMLPSALKHCTRL